MSPAKYLFTMVCRRDLEGKNIQTEEHIVAETMKQALAYWEIDLQCLNTEVLSISKQVPVIAICPQDKR